MHFNFAVVAAKNYERKMLIKEPAYRDGTSLPPSLFIKEVKEFPEFRIVTVIIKRLFGVIH